MNIRKCMNDDTLTSYLDGSLKAAERLEAEGHLINCDACRSQLVYFMRILDEDVEPEEESILEAAMEEWKDIAPPVTVRRRAFSLGWAALAASVLIATGIGVVYVPEPAVPTYAEVVELNLLNRPTRDFEARLSLFDTRDLYRPFVAIRSVPDPLPADVQGLADPTALEGEELSNHTLGLASLADGDFDRAVEFLELAIIESDGAAARNDLGVAYLEGNWGSAELQASYLAQAKNQFEIAARRDPDFLPAVFNLVLWFDRAELLAEMQDQGARYLEVDSDSLWADEIRAILGRAI